MRESIGHVQLYNIVILFIFLVMAIVVGALAYNRTFKVNTVIVGLIERFEGYNAASRGHIAAALTTMSYEILAGRTPRCPDTWGGDVLITPANEQPDYQHHYCIYRSPINRPYGSDNIGYIQYTVVTYTAFDILPYIDLGGIPTVSKTNQIWCVGDGCNL